MLQNYKRTIVFFTCAILSTQCLATSQNYAQIKAIPRGSSVHLTTGSRITNTPYGYYIPSFGNMKIESVKHVNLSKYANKKILIGYGIYDINNQYCKYLDVPSNSTFDLDFADRMVYGNQTFGISRNPMTFTQCRALVAKYNGYIYTPNTAAQMYYVYNAFNKTGIKNMWLGYHRVSCTQPYLNGQRFQQSYTNLLPKTTTCNANDLDTYVHSTNAQDYFWTRTNGDKKFYCPIMIDSPNYLRPIKVCLPWWKIQREWEIPKSKFNPDVFKFNGHTYNFSYAKYLIDYPLTRIVCTVPAPKALQAYQQGASFQETCRSYDSMKQSPSCMYDINKPVCKVNECYGYIQDHCTPEPSKDITLSGVKNYQYGYIMVHGVRERVKVIQNIKIHMYKCTPPPPLESQCKQFEKVKVFPKTCPDSNQCSQLATCLKNDVTTSQQCQAEYKCVKTYGSVDNPVYTNGVLSGFRGICPDGKTVIAPVQRLYSGTSKCLAYNQIKDTNTTIKTCISHATSTKETVSTAITTKDIYQSNPRCIRTNNMAEAEPAVHMVFQYTNEGFMNTDIQKVYINGHKQDNTSLTPTNYLDDSTSMVNSKYSQNGTAIKASRVSPTYSSLTTLWNNAFLMHDQSKSKTITLNIPAYSDLQVQSSNHNSCDDENVITGTYINGKSTFTAHCKKIPGPPLMTGWVTAYDNHLNSKSIKVTFKAYTEHVSSAKSKASSDSTFKYRIVNSCSTNMQTACKKDSNGFTQYSCPATSSIIESSSGLYSCINKANVTNVIDSNCALSAKVGQYNKPYNKSDIIAAKSVNGAIQFWDPYIRGYIGNISILPKIPSQDSNNGYSYKSPDEAKLLREGFTGFTYLKNAIPNSTQSKSTMYAVYNGTISKAKCESLIKGTSFAIAYATNQQQEDIIKGLSLESNKFNCVVSSNSAIPFSQQKFSIKVISSPTVATNFVCSPLKCSNHECQYNQCPTNFNGSVYLPDAMNNYLQGYNASHGTAIQKTNVCTGNVCDSNLPYLPYCGNKSGCANRPDVYQQNNGTCAKITCPQGTTYNRTKGECEKYGCVNSIEKDGRCYKTISVQ